MCFTMQWIIYSTMTRTTMNAIRDETSGGIPMRSLLRLYLQTFVTFTRLVVDLSFQNRFRSTSGNIQRGQRRGNRWIRVGIPSRHMYRSRILKRVSTACKLHQAQRGISDTDIVFHVHLCVGSIVFQATLSPFCVRWIALNQSVDVVLT